MRRFVEGIDRGQATLFPECLEDWIGEDNPVRVVDVFAEELDLAELGFGGVDPEATGRPSYQGRYRLSGGRVLGVCASAPFAIHSSLNSVARPLSKTGRGYRKRNRSCKAWARCNNTSWLGLRVGTATAIACSSGPALRSGYTSTV